MNVESSIVGDLNRMLLQTNSYIVPPEQREAHARLIEQFRQTMQRLGCDSLEIYEQVGPNWDASQSSGRFVQILRFRDREHQLAVQAAEREDKDAQALISQFCELINFPYQQEHGYFAVGFYTDIESREAESTAFQPPASPFSQAAESPNSEETAYLDRDLDSIAEDLGAPPLRLAPIELEVEEFEPPKEAEQHAPPENHKSTEPFVENEELLDLGQVLDAGLANDTLDDEMAAELLDDEDIELPPRAKK